MKIFTNLFCEISFENEKDVEQKLTKFAPILGILNNDFKQNLVHKFLIMKMLNPLALLILLYGYEIWTNIKKVRKHLTSLEMNFSEEQPCVHPF